MKNEAMEVVNEIGEWLTGIEDGFGGKKLYTKASNLIYNKINYDLDKYTEYMLCLIELAKESKDNDLLNYIVGANDLFFKKTSQIYLDINLKIAEQFWSTNNSDVIGSFQFLKDKNYIDQLYKIAVDSLPSWEERQDENQQFFRKCTWALGEISTREFGESRAIDVLLEMAKVEPPIAAYWAKKQLNRRLDNSPYADEDLSESPEVDFDWPSPRS